MRTRHDSLLLGTRHIVQQYTLGCMDRADVIVTACAFIDFIIHVMTSDSPAYPANRVLSMPVSFRRRIRGGHLCRL